MIFKRRIPHKPEFQDLPLIIGLLSILVVIDLFPIVPNDYWFHLNYGKELFITGRLPWNDTTSFTMTGARYESIGIYWFAESIMYLLHQALRSWEIVSYALILLFAYWMISRANVLRSGNKLASGLALIISMLLGFTSWNIRPQIFAYAYFALIYLVFIKFNDQTLALSVKLKIIYGAVIVSSLLLWQNSHGSFIFGYFLVTLLIIRRASGKKLVIYLVSLISLVFITPLGFSITDYFARMFSGNMADRAILEWLPPTLSELNGQIFYPLLLVILSLAFLKPKLKWTEAIVFLFFLILSIRYRRGIVFFGMASSPFIALALSKVKFFVFEKPITKFQLLINRTIVLLMLCLVFLTLPPVRSKLPPANPSADSYKLNTPTSAVIELENSLPPGNVFAHMSYAAYIPYQTHAKYKIFLDTRLEFYPDIILNDYHAIDSADQGWEAVAQKYPIDHWLLSKKDQPALIKALRTSNVILTKLIFEDDEFILFTNTK